MIIFLSMYTMETKTSPTRMPLPKQPEESPNYELNVDAFELKEVDPNDKREWKKKGEDEYSVE